MIKYINISNNTIYLTDISLNIPYDNIQRYISLQLVKKSYSFQSLIHDGLIQILQIGDSTFEQSLKKRDVLFCKKQYKKIKYAIRGNFLDHSGFAKVNRNLIYALNECGLSFKAITNTEKKISIDHDQLQKISQYIDKDSQPQILIDSCIPTFANADFGKYKILLTTVQSYSIPEQFLQNANKYDQLWVNSDFCKQIFVNSGYKKQILVVPNIIDFNLYTDNGQTMNLNKKQFSFISVFNWNWRKGYDILIKSYLKEFTKNDNVSLILVCKDFFGRNSDQIKSYIKSCINQQCKDNNPHIILLDGNIKQIDMPKLYRSANCFVGTTRGQSFFNPLIQASSCGLPIITTNISGQKMFINKDNSLLLQPQGFQRIKDGTSGVHFWDNQIFPIFSEKSIIQNAKLLRQIYRNYSKYKDMNLKLKKFAEYNYSAKSVSNIIKERIK